MLPDNIFESNVEGTKISDPLNRVLKLEDIFDFDYENGINAFNSLNQILQKAVIPSGHFGLEVWDVRRIFHVSPCELEGSIDKKIEEEKGDTSYRSYKDTIDSRLFEIAETNYSIPGDRPLRIVIFRTKEEIENPLKLGEILKKSDELHTNFLKETNQLGVNNSTLYTMLTTKDMSKGVQEEGFKNLGKAFGINEDNKWDYKWSKQGSNGPIILGEKKIIYGTNPNETEKVFEHVLGVVPKMDKKQQRDLMESILHIKSFVTHLNN